MKFEEVLQTRGTLVYTNVGVSMLPWIHEKKDLMIIETVRNELKKYDVVLFVRPTVEGRGHYVLHRIMKKYEDGSYYIIGDNTLGGERVQPENILGILTAIQQPERLIRVTDRDYQIKVRLWWTFVYPVRTFYRKRRGSLVKVLKRYCPWLVTLLKKLRDRLR